MRTKLSALTGGFAGLAALVTLIVACNQPPAVNPWVDDSISQDQWTTPSRDLALASGQKAIARETDFPTMNAPYVSPGVPHYPLWWEDPFDDQGDNNETFAITWQDYVAMPYVLGRFLLNTMAWPVSAVVTPPGTIMVSDGYVNPAEHPHDARLGQSPNPTAELSDFGF
ncbi:MAG: hypothetical protein GXY44_15300 [Phycisphaerales bacterium]|nr:hypothetical protein [Phycisphaerales bacterium]